MAITFVSADFEERNNHSDVNTLTVTAPTGITDDDVLVAIFTRTGTTGTISLPAGFTEINSDTWRVNLAQCVLGYKVASSESGDYVFTTTDTGTQQVGAVIAVYRGVDTASPLDVTFAVGSHFVELVNDQTPTPATITTNTNGAFVLTAYIDRHASNHTVTQPSGYTQAAQTSASNNALGRCAEISHIEKATAGLETPGDYSTTGDTGVDVAIHTIALKPGVSDSTAPILSNGSLAEGANGPTEATWQIDTDEDNGTLYAWFTANATETAADVKTNGGTVAVSATGTQGPFTTTGYPPGTALYLHLMHEDAATNQSLVTSLGPLTTTAYSVSATYSGGEIPSNSILHYAAWTHDAATSATIMTDSGESFTVDEFIDLIIENRTDASEGPITDNAATTITTSGLTGGTGNNFESGDSGAVVADIDSPDIIYCENRVTVSSESAPIKWYIYDNSAGTYTEMYTQTITATGATDGQYDVTLSVLGVPTLTLVTGGAGGIAPGILARNIRIAKSRL